MIMNKYTENILLQGRMLLKLKIHQNIEISIYPMSKRPQTASTSSSAKQRGKESDKRQTRCICRTSMVQCQSDCLIEVKTM